jgi:hypothetical protein
MDLPLLPHVNLIGSAPETHYIQINKDEQFFVRQFSNMNDGVFEFDSDEI